MAPAADEQVLAASAGSAGGGAPAAPPIERLDGNEPDCLGCRVTGLMLGLGGCGYISSRLWEQPYPRGGHRVAIITASAALLVFGVGRAVGL